MITEFLVDLGLRLAIEVAGFVPELEVDTAGIGDVLGLGMAFNGAFPVVELLAVGAMLLSVTGVMFAWRLARTLLSHVPWIGGSG